MKETPVKISGFTTNTAPDDRPAVCIYGEENVGKTRCMCTAPHDDGLLGILALDKNAKRSVDEWKQRDPKGKNIIVNDKPFMTGKEGLTLAMKDCKVKADLEVITKTYSDAFNRVLEAAVRLAESPDVESIGIDNGSLLFDMILFSHFGRKNQIESYQRGAPNQDMIDLISALRFKNLALVCRSSEIWKDTGEVDSKGARKQGPSGKFKPDGFGKLGYFMTAVVELSAKRTGMAVEEGDEEEALEKKYRLRVQTCKGNTLMEGRDLHDYGVSGRAITWANLMAVIGVGQGGDD